MKNYLFVLLAAVLLFGCVDSSLANTRGIANITDFGDMPEAINNQSSGWFGFSMLIVFFIVPMVVLSAYNKRENALLVSLFITFILSGLLVALKAVSSIAPVVLLTLIGGVLLYSFLKPS